MKKLLLTIAIAAAAASASAATFWYNGVLMGNVCRSGIYYTVYPIQNAQAVGSSCPLRDNFGNVVGWGFVSNE